MGDKSKKLVKVDNWGMFFLQRLQQHYHRNEFCDFTLQFGNNQQVKAHRLVLDVCTEYFQVLEKQGLVQGEIIFMPEDMQPDVVIPVINFMYTGRLEFRTEIQSRLYLTAQKMKMTVLTKLLDAQTNTSASLKVSPSTKPQGSPLVRAPLKNTGTPSVLANAQQKIVRRLEPSLPQMLPGRKLPIWTRRSIPVSAPVESIDFDRPVRFLPSVVDNTPRPTRFEWPDEEEEPSNPLSSTFEDISYESKPLMQPKDQIVRIQAPATVTTPPPQPRRTASFEDVLRSTTKRPNMNPVQSDPAKRARTLDLQDVKEYVEEAQVRKNLLDNEDSEEDVDGDLDGDDGDESYTMSPHKGILKVADVPTTPSSKRVRFSLDVGTSDQDGKENSASPSRALPTRAEDATQTNVTNHAKIITEVLKKYPHLVANNKNIRLKIMQRGGTGAAPATEGKSKAKVSYVVLKSDVKGPKQEGVVGQGSPRVATGAQNVTGPWLCHTCGSNENPLNFESYYLYRRHLQEVHMEKIDARICEHCGHRASKRNLLLYHLYTKHGVLPPRNCQFPKCDQCDYVALSESLLIKHRHNHSNNREFVCRVCNATFKSNGALQGHMQTNLHSDPAKRLYECPYCQKPFVRNINLKAHIRVAHRDVRGVEDLDGDELEGEEGHVLEVPVMNMVAQSGMTVLASNPASSEPSSEAEALTNVASGIAASLGLTDQQTVILLDENQEFIIHTGEVIGDQYIQDGVVQEVQEYIVPEIINEEQHQTAEVAMETDQQYTEGPPVSGTEEVFMVLTDHCYAEGDSGTQLNKQETTDGKALVAEVVQEYYVAKNHIEQVLASFEEDPTAIATENSEPTSNTGYFPSELPKESTIVTRQTKPVLEPKVPLTVGMKTYSPLKKPPLPNKTLPPKPPVAMSNLLDDWDEESSQEGNIPEDRLLPAPHALPTRGEILPTRGEIPEEFFSGSVVTKQETPPTATEDRSANWSVVTKQETHPTATEDRSASYMDSTNQVTESLSHTTTTSREEEEEEAYEAMEIDQNTQFLNQVETDQITLVAQDVPFVVESEDSGRTFFQNPEQDSSFIQETGSIEIEVPDHNSSLLPENEHHQLPVDPETEDAEESTLALENHHQSTSHFKASEQEKTLEGDTKQDKLLNAESGLVDTSALTQSTDQTASLPAIKDIFERGIKSESLSDQVTAENTPSETR